jgi:transposase
MKNKHISSLVRKKKERIRIKAAKLFEKNIVQAEVARKFKVTPAAVNYWHKAWKKQSIKGLKSKGRPGFESKLTDEKRILFKKAVLKGPLAFGYQTNLWTLSRLASVMKKVTKVKFSGVWTWNIVRSLGFTCQKPQVKAKQQDKQAIKEWGEKRLPDLKKMGDKTWILSGL